jgi:hypothetical protein
MDKPKENEKFKMHLYGFTSIYSYRNPIQTAALSHQWAHDNCREGEELILFFSLCKKEVCGRDDPVELLEAVEAVDCAEAHCVVGRGEARKVGRIVGRIMLFFNFCKKESCGREDRDESLESAEPVDCVPAFLLMWRKGTSLAMLSSICVRSFRTRAPCEMSESNSFETPFNHFTYSFE